MKTPENIVIFSDTENDESYNFRLLFNKYLYHWPLFVVGLLICILGALFYLKKTNPVYTVTASVIIKDETKEPDKKNNLQELYLSNSPKLVENEIEVLGSRNLISQVVTELQLWVNYQGRAEDKTIDLYKNTPVAFTLINTLKVPDRKILNIRIKDDKSFYLEEKKGSLREFSFKDIIKSTFGTWQLNPTPTIRRFKDQNISILINDPNRIAEEYQKNIKVELPNKLASTISLMLKDEVEQRGKDILNGLIDNYNETSIAEKNRTTKRTLDFIDNRISSLANELNSSEKNIEGYRSSRGITDISSQSQIYLENVQANDSKLNEVTVQLNVIDGIDKYLNSAQNTQSAPSTLGITDPLLNSSIQKLSQLQLERQKLLATTPETNPDFEIIDRQIRVTKHTIKENIDNIKSSLLLTKDKLQSFNSKYESSIKNVPVQERQLVDKTRQQSIKENLYVYLLQKREEVALNYSSILSDAKILDYAYSNTKTSGKLFVLGIAGLLGILLPAGLIYGRTVLNNRVTTDKEIQEETGMPVFCELSYVDTSSPLVAPGKDSIAISEEFRKLRTNLNQLKGKAESGWITLITSSIPNEGKSFIAANLGYFLAASGKKTVILEMDWRRPKISGIFKLTVSDTGIATFLEDDLQIASLIQNSGIHPSLDIIGSGPLPSNPSELLDNEKIDTLVNWLKKQYQHIIIDTPPLHLVTDAKILSRLSDTILYVIRQGYTYKPLMKFVKSLAEQDQFSKIKIVFNGVKKGRYGYGYNYGKDYYQLMNGAKKNIVKRAFTDFIKRF